MTSQQNDHWESQDAARRMRRRRRRAIAIGVPSAAALAAIGIVATSAGSTGAATHAPSSISAAPAGTVVKTAQSPTLGTILVDGRGMTLYTLTNNGKAVSCTGPCATVWPPLTLAPGATLSAQGVGGIASTAGPTGAQLVTHNGLPLYRFTGDNAPGDTNGEGMDTFGGEWHVVKAGSGPTTLPAQKGGARPNTTPRPAAGGYGY